MNPTPEPVNPKPEIELTTKELARHLGRTQRMLASWRANSCPSRICPMTGKIMWKVSEVKTWLAGRPRADRGGGRVGSADPESQGELKDELLRQRVRKETALADVRELAASKTRGDLVAREDVEQAALEKLAIVRAGLLAMAGKLAPRLAFKDARVIQRDLDAACRELLAAFAGKVRGSQPSQGEGEDKDAA